MAYHFRREILNVNQAGFFNFKVAHGYYYRHALFDSFCMFYNCFVFLFLLQRLRPGLRR